MEIKLCLCNNYSFIKNSIVTLLQVCYLRQTGKSNCDFKRERFITYQPLEFRRYCGTVLYCCYINLHQVIFHSASNHAFSLKSGNFIPENGIEMN